MTGMLPDYVLLAVCGVRGLGRVGRQHLAVALALELPLVVAITKADVAEPPALAALTAKIRCGVLRYDERRSRVKGWSQSCRHISRSGIDWLDFRIVSVSLH